MLNFADQEEVSSSNKESINYNIAAFLANDENVYSSE